MSYILEALQEAQKNRDDARVPTLRTVQAERPVKPKRSKNWLMPLIVFGILGFAGVLMYRWLGGIPESAVAPDSEVASTVAPDTVTARAGVEQPSETIVQSPPRASTEVAPTPVVVEQTVMEQAPEATGVTTPPVQTPATEAAPDRVSPKASVTPAHDVEPPKEVAKARAPVSSTAGASRQVEGSPVVGSSATIQGNVPQVLAPASGTANAKLEEGKLAPVSAFPTRSAALNKAATQDITKAKAVTETTVPSLDDGQDTAVAKSISRPEISSYVVSEAEAAQAEVSADQEPVAEVAEERQVPHFRELPYDVQQSLPGISYSVHLYAAEPSHRMVKIDGRVRREGDTIKPGLVLKEITPTGAVFSYRDNIFRVPVNG